MIRSLTVAGHPKSEPLDDNVFNSDYGCYHTGEENPQTGSLNGSGSDCLTSPATHTLSIPSKRRYKRHPKADDNAPIRPASAYVLFANQVREQQKDSNLNFTQLARLVGDRWKNLGTAEKEAIEAQAGEAKKQYNAEVANYKKSREYQLYQDYLVEFKERALKDEKPEKLEPPKKSQKLNIHDSPDVAPSYPYQSVHRSVDQIPSLPPAGRQFFALPSLIREPPGVHPPGGILPPPAGYATEYASPAVARTPESFSRQTHLPYPLPIHPLSQSGEPRSYDARPRLPSIRTEHSKEDNCPPRSFADHRDNTRR